jgi:hypothetical protein
VNSPSIVLLVRFEYYPRERVTTWDELPTYTAGCLDLDSELLFEMYCVLVPSSSWSSDVLIIARESHI